MKRALIIVLFAAVAFAGTKVVPHRAGPRLLGPQSVNPNHPTFQFAPANGTGMGTACACTTPTGLNGDGTAATMTFTRASSGTCFKGSMTARILNGDMNTCTNNQPRVMAGDDGGVVGLLVEATGTNVVLHSQEFDDPAWSFTASGVANPTVAANSVVAPDGTVTADHFTVPATTTAGSQYSLIQSGIVLTALQNASVSIFVRGNGTTGSICLAAGNASNSNCLCPYDTLGWTRCVCENKSIGGSASPLYFGNYSAATGPCGINFGAQDVFIWGAHGETAGSAYVTSYIATTSAAIARLAETADVAVSIAAGTTGISFAGSSLSPNTIVSNEPLFATFDNTAPGATSLTNPYWYPFYNGGNGLAIDAAGTASSASSYNTVFVPSGGALHRFVTYHTGALMNGCLDGTCAAGTASTWNAAAIARVRLGRSTSGTSASQLVNGVVKLVCLDSSSTRCR